MPLLDSIPTAGAGLTAGGASIMDQLNTGLMDIAKLKRYDQEQTREQQRLDQIQQAAQQEQKMGRAKMLLDMYDEIGDPTKFQQAWNNLAETDQNDWGGISFTKRVENMDWFTDKNGNRWYRNKGELDADGKPTFHKGTPEQLSESIDQDIAAKRKKESVELRSLELRGLSTLGRLTSEYNALPQGDPLRETYQAAIEKESTRSGEKITVNPDGTVTLERGGGAGGLTKPMETDIQKQMLGQGEHLMRLSQIANEFDPKYLEIGPRLEAKVASLKERLGGEPDPEAQALLYKYQSFRRKSIENINRYIKEVTGAQMSEAEANRLRLAEPDPGEGIWPKQSGTEFKANLNDTIRGSKLAVARYNYYLSQGLTEQTIKKMVKDQTAVSLDGTESLMRKRREEIKKQYPGITSEEIVAQLTREFGL